jgi:NifU-like protein
VKGWWKFLGAGPAAPRGDALRLAEVDAVLSELEPLVAADGGRIELRAVEGDQVVVALRGACEHCSASDLTLQGLLEPRLRERLAWFEALRVEP